MRLPEKAPDLYDLLTGDQADLVRIMLSHRSPVDAKGRYLHWDEVRSRQPPEGLDRREWWAAMRLARSGSARNLPLVGIDGSPLSFTNVDEVQRCVHQVDQEIGGRVGTPAEVSANVTRNFVRSLEEEAITSSQLEGATTTRRDAKQMLATGREPRDLSERMILNNYRAMNRVKELTGDPLSPAIVLELHRVVTEGTLEEGQWPGQIQTASEQRVGVYANDDTLVHQPPPADELKERLEMLCAFANGASGDGFLHPVVRAVVVHFMLAYDHPFADGNGRTARALFYWSMMRSGYALVEYVSISALLKQAPARYSRAFQYVETDGGDVTYFVLHQLDVLIRAIHDLWSYVERRARETRQIEQVVRGSDQLNHRQLAAIRDALHDPGLTITAAGHQRAHGVTNETARSDLRGLEGLDLFEKRKRGKAFHFMARPDLDRRLQALGEEAAAAES